MEDLICVKKFEHWEEAEVAQKMLESEGIECYIETEEGGGMTPTIVARSCLMVKAADSRRAVESLNIRK